MKECFSRFCGILLLAALTSPLHAGKVLAEVEYFYAPDNTLVGKAFNGKRVNFEYDLRGQLLAVTDAEGNDLERYTYDPAGNRLSKKIGDELTTYRYDNANQLVSSTTDGVITQYRYDAAGRMVQAGDKTYSYLNNKVSEVRQNGNTIAKFEYNIDGQISKAVYGDKTEEFIWDGPALVWRSGVTYVNEPYITGGNPILAGDDVLFNDMLGNTLTVNERPVEMTSFGETNDSEAFFTGKPMIEELGYSFLFRDYNPSQGRWTTSDPLGYPDGWNNLVYVNNEVTGAIDRFGTDIYHFVSCYDCGHSACIIGNPETGYFAYSFCGAGGGYGYCDCALYENPKLEFAVVTGAADSSDYLPAGIANVNGEEKKIYAYKTPSLALINELLKDRPTEMEYFAVQKWVTTSEQDLAAREAIRDCINDGFRCEWYHVLFNTTNNCMDSVDAALDAAGVQHHCNGWLDDPVYFWILNFDYAINLNYFLFKKGHEIE